LRQTIIKLKFGREKKGIYNVQRNVFDIKKPTDFSGNKRYDREKITHLLWESIKERSQTGNFYGTLTK